MKFKKKLAGDNRDNNTVRETDKEYWNYAAKQNFFITNSLL